MSASATQGGHNHLAQETRPEDSSEGGGKSMMSGICEKGGRQARSETVRE